jgi:hypothetical protein
MDDTSLDQGLREGRLNGVEKAFQTIDYGDHRDPRCRKTRSFIGVYAKRRRTEIPDSLAVINSVNVMPIIVLLPQSVP